MNPIVKNFMQNEQKILKKGICRTPLFSFNKLEKIDEIELRDFALIPIVQEALSIASAVFYQEVLKWLNGEIIEEKRISHIHQTLYKYLSRASTRCTPFGVFSSTSFVEIDNSNEISNLKTHISDTLKSKTRLDPCSLQLLIDYFNNIEELRFELKYNLNNSIYNLGSHYRYFEVKKGEQDIYFELSKIPKNEYLELIFSFCSLPKSLIEIRNSCFQNEYSDEDIFSFLDELINEKVLFSELEFTLSESNTLEKLLTILKTKETNINSNSLFTKGVLVIETINNILIDNNISIDHKHKLVSDQFTILEISVNPKDLIHTDSYRNIEDKIEIDDSLHTELLETKDLLLKLDTSSIDNFSLFKRNFRRRYEDRTMPLLQVLDPETGIGYSQKNEDGDINLLLNNIDFPSEKSSNNFISLSSIDILLMNKILECQKNGLQSINITAEEFRQFPINKVHSDTLSVFITLLGNNNSILLNSFSGSTAISLMSRFSYLDQKIEDLCLEISKHEIKRNENCIIAEIRHVPELKSGNLLFNKCFRDFEIPCVTSSEKTSEKTILLSDIYIKINHNNKIELLSKKMGKKIIPKLSNSINYNRNSINVFRFLSDFQYQDDVQAIDFSWQNLSNLFNFFPRVNYKRIILSPAYWVINKKELFKAQSEEDFKLNFIKYRNERNIPNKFFLSRSIKDDNKLYVDLSNRIGFEVFKKEILKGDQFIISEIFHDHKTSFVDKSNNYYNNEIILPLIKLAVINKEYNNKFIDLDKTAQVQHLFHPGSEWISYKLYIGHKTADDLIKTEILDIATMFYNEGVISKWFFVRYADEDVHLRVRFLITKTEYLSIIIDKMESLFKSHIENNMMHNVVIDTYKREVDRYRPEYINLCESLFCTDSFAVASFMETNSNEDERWVFGFLGINAYLDDFDFQLSEKLNLIEYIFNQYFIEFRGNKELNLQLDKKFRAKKTILSNFIFKKEFSEDGKKYTQILNKRSEQNKNIISELKKKGFKKESDVTLSLIHMFLNRLFISNHRKQELVLYYLLLKHYKSELAQSKLIDGNLITQFDIQTT